MIQSLKTIKKVERSPMDTLKMSLAFGLDIAVDTAVTLALKQLIPVTRGWKGLLAKVGVFVLGMMAGEKAEEWVYAVVDDTKKVLSETQQSLMDGSEGGEPEDGGGK